MEPALDLLRASDSALNVVFLPGAAHKPKGDVILCDMAREDASVILSDLRELRIPTEGYLGVPRARSRAAGRQKPPRTP